MQYSIVFVVIKTVLSDPVSVTYFMFSSIAPSAFNVPNNIIYFPTHIPCYLIHLCLCIYSAIRAGHFTTLYKDLVKAFIFQNPVHYLLLLFCLSSYCSVTFLVPHKNKITLPSSFLSKKKATLLMINFYFPDLNIN